LGTKQQRRATLQVAREIGDVDSIEGAGAVDIHGGYLSPGTGALTIDVIIVINNIRDTLGNPR
jgi:hypothetical protein